MGNDRKKPWSTAISGSDSLEAPAIEKRPIFQAYFSGNIPTAYGLTCLALKALFGGFLKWKYPQIIYFNKIFHYKPSSYWGPPIYGNPQNDSKHNDSC
jgi:hypothetical protein